MENSINLIVFLPLIGFLINGVFGKYLPNKIVGAIATAVVFIPFLLALNIFFSYQSTDQSVVVKLFEWFRVGSLNVDFGFMLDQLSLMMVLIITGIGSLIHLYSIGYMAHDNGFYKFFTYLNLFIFSMLFLVLGSNYLILFIGWEGVGLCSFLLIGFWYENPEYTKAARKAFIMNRIGDLGLLLGIFAIAYSTHSLDYLSLSENTDKFSTNSPMVLFITLSLFIGAMGKSAQIPLYTWLPDAMAGPTPVSALIHAATMVTSGVYLVVRSNFFYSLAPYTLDIILYIGLATSLIAAFIGLRQNDIKKVLAYSTVSQLGFMFIALGTESYTTAMFHLMTHAFFKALLFLGAGSVIHAMSGEQDMRFMGGLYKKIPITSLTFLIGTLAIIGVPPLSGMISKDEILTKIWEHSPILWGLTLFSAMLTAIYMLRMFFLTFFGSFRGNEHQKSHLHESPLVMTIPLVVLAILAILGGFINLPHFISHEHSQQLANWLGILIKFPKQAHEISFSSEIILLLVTVIMLAVVFLVTRNLFVTKKHVAKPIEELSGWQKWSANKLYVDELYDASIVNSTEQLGRASKIIDEKVLFPLVVNFGTLFPRWGKFLKRVQNGNVETYVMIMSLAVGLILIINLINQS